MEFTKNSKDFNFEIYKPLFNNIISSYKGEKFAKNVDLNGGRGSGKSNVVTENVVFWLPEIRYHEAVWVVFSAKHKENVAELIEQKLHLHGYGSTFQRKNLTSGNIRYFFGNDNVITIISISTSSKVHVVDSIKTIEFVNSKKLQNPLKFMICEEFTAILNYFDNIGKCMNALSSFNRHKNEGAVNFYLYNPPENKVNIVFDWQKIDPEMLRIRSTIYDLPEIYQSKDDLLLAEQLKKLDIKQFQHIYLGLSVGEEGLAYQIDESIFIEFEEFNDNLYRGIYKSFHVQTDEGTRNATAFSLLGITHDDELHFITNYYHSSLIDGVRKAPSEYAFEFNNWYRNLPFKIETIGTDGIAFVEELRVLGFESRSVHKIKNRELQHRLLKSLILTKRFKIVNVVENKLLFEQIYNAQAEFTKDGKEIVSKKFEATSNDQKLHTHLLDCVFYTLLTYQRTFLEGNIYGRKI